MTITQVLLFFLAGSPLFSNAGPYGNAYKTALQVNKDAPITCSEGFIIDGTLTRCIRAAAGYEDTCEESKQCSEFLSVGAVCQDSQCLCLDGYHYLHGKCHKSKGLFENCEKDTDCFVYAEYNAVACIENVCKCRDGFYQREYSTCRRKAKDINDDCLIHSDCAFNEDAICINQKCNVNEVPKLEEAKDYNYNKERDKSITSMSSASGSLIGDDCKEDKDCGFVQNSYCGADKKCTCLRAYFASDTSSACIPEIGEKCTDNDKLHVENTVCKDGQWTCTIDHIPSKNNRLCNEVPSYDENCNSNERCQLLGPRAKCEKKSCQCDSTSHWLQNETFCWITRRLEEECKSNNDCFAMENSLTPVCQKEGNKKLCTCPEKSHMRGSSGYKVCIADQTELGSYCIENSDCKVVNSICQSNKCECDDNYFKNGKKCLPGLSTVCKENTDCELPNTQCLQNKDRATCQCANNFVATPEKKCIAKSTFNETCNCNLQCSSVTANAICMTNETSIRKDDCWASNVGKCSCIEEDYYRDGACFKKKKLGQECSKEGECFTKGEQPAVCRNGICSCDFNYARDGDYCIPMNYGSSIKMSLWTMLLLAALV